MDLQSAVQIQSDVKLTDGPGHGENFYAPNTGDRASNWYFGEIGARAAGAGMSMVDEQIWGTSHLHLNILRVLDPARFEKEIASFTHKFEMRSW